MRNAKQKFWELPWDCQRWWTSPTRAKMGLAARGLYREMLDYQWMEGKVPDDPDVVASLLGLPVEEVGAAWPQVRLNFGRSIGRTKGVIANKRLEQIRRVKTGGDQSRIEHARVASQARWAKQKTYDARAMHIDANNRTIEQENNSNEQTIGEHAESHAQPNGVSDSPPDLTRHLDRLKEAYAQINDAQVYSHLTDAAWVDSVMASADPWKELKLVSEGFIRLRASGTPRQFVPALPRFLRERRYLESWPKRVEGTGLEERIKNL